MNAGALSGVKLLVLGGDDAPQAGCAGTVDGVPLAEVGRRAGVVVGRRCQVMTAPGETGTGPERRRRRLETAGDGRQQVPAVVESGGREEARVGVVLELGGAPMRDRGRRVARRRRRPLQALRDGDLRRRRVVNCRLAISSLRLSRDTTGTH